MRLGLSLIGPAVMGLYLSLPATAAEFTFTKIADNSGPLQPFGSPSLNDQGVIVFSALLNKGGSGLFVGSGRSSGGSRTKTIVKSSGSAVPLSAPSISNQGIVAFGNDEARGIFTHSGTKLTPIADSSGTLNTFPASTPAINDQGIVAFRAELDTGISGLFTGSSGAPITTIVDNASSTFDSFGPPVINERGTVAFSAELRPQEEQNSVSGIFTSSNGAIKTIADSKGSFTSFSPPSLNDNDTIAFKAALDVGSSGIFTSHGTTHTTVVDSSGPFNRFDQPSINNEGKVAFLAFLDQGGYGIFIGPDPKTDKVIGVGDSLFGSTVADIALDTEGLNNSNQVAFYALLANGTYGIYRADPVSGPQPR